MTIIISDTSPLHYLVLIGESQVLPALYVRIIIPQKVLEELRQPNTPAVVQAFANAPPSWLEVRTISSPPDSSLDNLDPGEREAIALALELQANTLLIDDLAGREAALLHGLEIVGTMGVLYAAAEAGLCELKDAFGKLRQTNFRASAALYQSFLDLIEQSRP